MNSIDNGMNGKLAGLDGKAAGRADGDGNTTRRTGSAGATATPAPSTAPAGEAVSLTRTAVELQQLETQLRETSGVDVERVESIRQAIADGRYTVDAQSVVDNLLRSEQELGWVDAALTTIADTIRPGADDSAAARLHDLLAAELARICVLETTLEAEYAALVGSDPAALEVATQAKNAAIAAQQEQQAHRTGFLRAQGIDATIPLDESIRRLNGSLECEELHQTMVRHAQRCQEGNRRNGVLIHRLQERTRGALNILRQSDQQPALYSTHGHREADDDTRSLGKA